MGLLEALEVDTRRGAATRQKNPRTLPEHRSEGQRLRPLRFGDPWAQGFSFVAGVDEAEWSARRSGGSWSVILPEITN